MQIFSVCLCFFFALSGCAAFNKTPAPEKFFVTFLGWSSDHFSMANRHLEIGYKKVTAWITWRFLSTAFSLQFATYSQIRFTHQSAMRGWLDDSERYSIFAREIPTPPSTCDPHSHKKLPYHSHKNPLKWMGPSGHGSRGSHVLGGAWRKSRIFPPTKTMTPYHSLDLPVKF